MKKLSFLFLFFSFFTMAVFFGACESPTGYEIPTREEKIPDDAIKITPDMDSFPPVLHSPEWESPEPVDGPINTAGLEDSPFITPDGRNFYFFFTPDADVPAQGQLADSVSGIWWSEKIGNTWTSPDRLILGSYESLDGAVFVLGDMMWFASVRQGNLGEIDIYLANFEDGEWKNVRNAGSKINVDYNVGELHISTDTATMYYGKGDTDKDIWRIIKTGEGWIAPVRVSGVNSAKNENQPFLTSDGKELWFTGESNLGYPGPAVFRSVSTDSGWTQPEEIISNFAGEPCLDSLGNIYFIHHFCDASMEVIEADVYVAEKK